MATPSISSAFYAPTEPPSDPQQFRYWIKDELLKVGGVLQLLAAGHIDMTYTAPSKPREGDMRLADGSSWNPGAGRGVYVYFNNTWNKL